MSHASALITTSERQGRSVSTPRFKLIVYTVAALTVLTLILNVLDSGQVKAAAEACSTTYKMPRAR